MLEYKPTTRILSWAEEDRPREKLLLKGKASLSDAELIGILLGSGTVSLSAVDLAKQILASVDNNLTSLAKLTIKDLEKFKGIGEAKAITIVAAWNWDADVKPANYLSDKLLPLLMMHLSSCNPICWICLMRSSG